MDNGNQSGVYLLHNPNTNEVYVGSGNLSDREYNHRYALERNIHANHKLQNAFNKDNNFKFVGVELESRSEAYEIEQAILDKFFDNPSFLNLSKKAISVHINHTPESRAKISQAHLGNKWNLGKKRSPESVEKIRTAHLGSKRSDQARLNMSNARKGMKMTEEVREKAIPNLSNYIDSKKQSVSIDGIIYDSIRDASRKLNVSYKMVHGRVNSESGKFSNWKVC